MRVSGDDFRDVLSCWSTGVTVVTSREGDEIHGMTVNSFSSLTGEPPLVLFCGDQSAHTHELVTKSGVFAVNILSEDQEEISNVFAGRNQEAEPDRFDGLSYREALTGAPIIDESLAYLDCRVIASHPQGTHTIFVGAVLVAKVLRPSGQPLLYFDRHYRQFASDEC